MKKKLLKSVSLVALSTVMALGAGAAFAGCGQNSEFEIRVSMFCGDEDVAINQATCNRWAADFTQRMLDNGTFEEGQAVSINFSSNADTATYFGALQRQISSNSQPDVFYVSPKYVRAWKHLGRVLDLSEYLTEKETGDIWEDCLAFYADSDDPEFTRGDRIKYENGKYVTVDDGVEVGVYALPKDYSNFGLGFNDVYFTKDLREKLTSTYSEDRTGVKGAQYAAQALTYESETGIAVDAAGKDVPLINIGKPTYYRPYNFYKFASYQSALAGGDPMANLVQTYTGGKGYMVTLPGWPGDTFEITDSNYKADDVEYDADKGYITYTYAEYSALTWVMTYYLNTFDWQGLGVGGVKLATGQKNVYGNDQYDGVLYLLPWLAGNDAQYLNQESTLVVNPGKSGDKKGTDLLTAADAQTYTIKKPGISGADRDVEVVWGANSDRFIETVGAFHAYGSDWNGNSNNTGDVDTKDSGWDMFCAGNVIFYGVGTWNSGVLNNTERQYLQYRLMPEPVSEKYALASWIKNADFAMQDYGASENGVCSKTFSSEDIIANQLERQDKWGARMDSVGYGVSGSITEGAAWRAEAAVDLVKFLTVNKDTQVSLTYAGSQLPNFKSQCLAFKNHDGDFSEMTTPEDSDWDAKYTVAKNLYAARSSAGNTTIKDWLASNGNGATADPLYENDPVSSVSSLSVAMKVLRLIAYKEADRELAFRMQYGLNATRDSAMYTYNDDWIDMLDARGRNMVMAYASQYSSDKMVDILAATLYAKDATSTKKPVAGSIYGTSAWFCLYQAQHSQNELNKAIQEEADLMA